jgi:hypothetical protein
VRPDPVEAVHVGGGQHLAAEALAPGRRGAARVGAQQPREQGVGALVVRQAGAHRRLDRGQGRQAPGEHPVAQHHRVAAGQRQ